MEDPSGFVVEDELAVGPLEKLGWNVQSVPWTADGMDWSRFDVVVIRSTWDYQKTPELFLTTLAGIESSGTRLFNPLSICQWNLHKSYLRELSGKGIPVVPTIWPCHLDGNILAGTFDDFRCDRIIVKPVIGANADDTYVLQRDDSRTWEIALQVFRDRPLMIQPFVDSVIGTGEYSLFYFGNQYSHAVIKNPREGDFRVQEEHGGTARAVQPPDELLGVGEQIMTTLGSDLLYARVDLVTLADGSPALIELELIEPSLHFSCDPKSPSRFAKALNEIANRL